VARTCAFCTSSINDSDAFCQSCGRAAGSSGGYGYGTMTETAAPSVATVASATPPSWAAQAPQVPMTANGSSAAEAPGGANDTYMGLRLKYDPQPEPSWDPIGSTRYLAQIALRAALYWAVGAFVDFVLFIFTAIVAGGSHSLSAIEGTGGFFTIVIFLFNLVLFICFWFLKVPIQLSEWKLTVDGKAAAAPTVFSHIGWVLYGRQTPIDSLRVQQFRLPGTGSRDYLELQSGIFYGYIACFPYGHDLYVGWTFWVRISPFRYLCMFVARIWQSLFNRGSDLYVSLRYDSARAMRETMHSATREGVDVAAGHLEAQGQGIVGTAIPVTEHAVTR
jgi:hypothetical protein